MKFLSLAVLALPSVFAAALPNTVSGDNLAKRSGGGALRTCTNAGAVLKGKDIYVEAFCSDGHGGSPLASVDVNTCIANDNGNLHWRKNGGFSGSCTIDLATGVQSNGYLIARCRKDNGSTVITGIYLNDHLVNRNGKLACEV
ncbi:hypothetical protein TWF694_000244 [Orbilia ellipsospora]|uniref:Cyanovirin-N domain-containing protein n=1 Tax=Orbilia ellipsospora TaxID=2528407 RepID=A0AAV9XUP8_9PEZI